VKKSISYWSFKDSDDYSVRLAKCFREAKAAGFQAVEPAMSFKGEITPATTKKECEAIAAGAKAARIEMASLATGLFWRRPLTSSDPAVREEGLDIGARLIERAKWLGLDAVLVLAGLVDADTSYDVCYERGLKAIKKLARVAARHRVRIGVENVWNKFLLSPLEMRDFVDACDSKYVGAYFDIGNVLLTGFPDQWIRILGRRIVRIHAKDFRVGVGNLEGFCDLLDGDVPWKKTMRALKAVGYKSYVTSEIVPWRRGLTAKTSRAMDKILSYAR